MTFAEHLEELRTRLIISLVSFGVAFLVAFAFQNPLTRFFTQPYRAAVTTINASLREDWAKAPHVHAPTTADRLDALVDDLELDKVLTKEQVEKLRGARRESAETDAPQLPLDLQGVGISETFASYMQVCMLVSALISAPILLLQVWKFIAAGLYDHEKKTVQRVLPWSLALFFVGFAFGFFGIVHFSVEFLVSYGDIDVVRPQVTVGSYFSLLWLLLLVMGLVFQIPLIMTVLASVGLVSPKWFRSKRRHCILAIFVIAAIITPPDYISQLIVAGPMLLLFEGGIFLAAGAEKRRAARLAEKDRNEGGGGNPPRNPKS
jgi:sec-independent protein translocase protein TatC